MFSIVIIGRIYGAVNDVASDVILWFTGYRQSARGDDFDSINPC